MDLRNLSSTPTQHERRPLLLSLLLTSGYALLSYGNTTPQLSNQRINQARSFLPHNSLGLNLQQWGQVAGNVAPWVEQQQQALGAKADKDRRSNPGHGGLPAANSPVPVPGTPHGLSGLNGLGHGPGSGSGNSMGASMGGSLSNSSALGSSGVGGIGNMLPSNGGPSHHRASSQHGPRGGPSGAGDEHDGHGSRRRRADHDTEPEPDHDDEDDDDELIPTAIVIKNIPFAIKKEQLLDVMTKLSLPLPYAFNYHFDNGVFRGLAFANFTSTSETLAVVNQLNGREIGGRKLRVEYKKMLPVQERERIEREKREKRGQLEEQHRLALNASLALLILTASTTAATKNLSVAGTTSQTERLFLNFPSQSLVAPPLDLNLNDPETLDLYTQLVLYRDDVSKLVFELAFQLSLALTHRKILSLVVAYLGLLELYDNGLIIIRRKPGQQSRVVVLPQPPSHLLLMMNISQYPTAPPISHVTGLGASSNLAAVTPPELLRSHLQLAIPVSTRPMAPASTTPIQAQFAFLGNAPGRGYGYGQSGNGGGSGGNGGSGSGNGAGSSGGGGHGHLSSNASTSGTGTAQGQSSAAALLRSNNRSFVDVRSTPPPPNNYGHGTELPTPQHHTFFLNGIQLGPSGQPVLQPGTPMGSGDINLRFAPFGQHSQLTGSFTSLTATLGLQAEEYGEVQAKFSSLSMGNGYDNSGSSSGIWGPK